jgi:nucleoside-diphosphate-sugar epimerase
MRVFVTGATGFIGSAVVRELHDAGHRVVGLARSDSAAAALTAADVEVHRGALDDLDSLHEGAAAADGVIHLAFNHDFSNLVSNFVANGKRDLRAVETLGAALEGTGKPLVVTSGTLMITMIAPGRLGTEEIVADPGSDAPRIASENAAIALAQRGVRTSVVRLAPTVHGEGDKGFVPSLIGFARENGVSAFVGDGSNRWPAVHRLDAARLFRLALENAPAGSMLHGTAEEGVPFREIAEVIGRQSKLPVAGVDAEKAGEHFGFLSAFVPLDNPTSSALTQRQLGWHPVQPALIPDLEKGHYFTD